MNIKIGTITIDNGIDYIHTNFGGTGLAADYTYAHTITGPVVITTLKRVTLNGVKLKATSGGASTNPVQCPKVMATYTP